MNFDKSKIIKQDNKNIYANKIDTDETLIFDEEYIFLDSIKTTKDIVVTKKAIVLGDLECNFLNALEEIKCYGNIVANNIYTNKDIEYFKDIKYNYIISGNVINKNSKEEIIKEVEVVKEVEKIVEVVKEKEVEKIIEVNSLEEEIKNNDILSNKILTIDGFKEKIVKYIKSERTNLNNEAIIKDLELIGTSFIEYKKYSKDLNRIVRYSKADKLYALNEYLEFLRTIKTTPKWLEEIPVVEDTIKKHKLQNEDDILKLDININNQEDFVTLISNTKVVKNKLGNSYDLLVSNIIKSYLKSAKIDTSLPEDEDEEEKESIVDIIKDVVKEEIENKIDLNEIYDKYIWEKGSLIECKIRSIQDDYMYLSQVDDLENNHTSIIMKIKSPINKKIGDTIYGYILSVEKKDNEVEIILSNDSDNMPRLLFNKLKEKYDLNKSTIQKYKRIKGKSTCIVIVLFNNLDYKENIRMLSNEIKENLDGEHVGIFVYDKKIERFAANILNIDETNIEIDKLSKKCIAKIEQCDEARLTELLDKQGTNIANIFGYKIELKVKSAPTVSIKDEPIAVEKTSQNINSNRVKYTNREVYMKLIAQKGKPLGGDVIRISDNEIEIDIGYNAEVIIKYFHKPFLEKCEIGDYMEGSIETISKKMDGSVRAVLTYKSHKKKIHEDVVSDKELQEVNKMANSILEEIENQRNKINNTKKSNEININFKYDELLEKKQSTAQTIEINNKIDEDEYINNLVKGKPITFYTKYINEFDTKFINQYKDYNIHYIKYNGDIYIRSSQICDILNINTGNISKVVKDTIKVTYYDTNVNSCTFIKWEECFNVIYYVMNSGYCTNPNLNNICILEESLYKIRKDSKVNLENAIPYYTMFIQSILKTKNMNMEELAIELGVPTHHIKVLNMGYSPLTSRLKQYIKDNKSIEYDNLQYGIRKVGNIEINNEDYVIIDNNISKNTTKIIDKEKGSAEISNCNDVSNCTEEIAKTYDTIPIYERIEGDIYFYLEKYDYNENDIRIIRNTELNGVYEVDIEIDELVNVSNTISLFERLSIQISKNLNKRIKLNLCGFETLKLTSELMEVDRRDITVDFYNSKFIIYSDEYESKLELLNDNKDYIKKLTGYDVELTNKEVEKKK